MAQQPNPHPRVGTLRSRSLRLVNSGCLPYLFLYPSPLSVGLRTEFSLSGGGEHQPFIYQGGRPPNEELAYGAYSSRGEGGFMHRHHVGFPSIRKDCRCEWSRTIENAGSADRLIDRDVMLTNRPCKNLQAPLLYKGSKPESFLFKVPSLSTSRVLRVY